MIKKTCLFVIFTTVLLVSSFAPALSQEGSLTVLLDKVTGRMSSYPDNDNWKYTVITRSTEMDKDWKPEKTTLITAAVKDADNVMSGRIVKAVVIEDGNETDISEKISKQILKRIEDTNKERIEHKGSDRAEDELDRLFPFFKNKITKFNFRKTGDTVINGKSVFIVEAVAKEKDTEIYEGTYYIDKKTYDVVKARIRPSKNPKFVKELDMDMDFEVLPEGNFMRRRSKTRVKGSFLFKKFRLIIEEEYTDVEIFNKNNRPDSAKIN